MSALTIFQNDLAQYISVMSEKSIANLLRNLDIVHREKGFESKVDYMRELLGSMNEDQLLDFIENWKGIEPTPNLAEGLDKIVQKFQRSHQPSFKKPVIQLVFAAVGYKPEIIFTDTLQYEIEAVKNKDSCLIYSVPISKKEGLKVVDLVEWWATLHPNDADPRQQLGTRLRASLTEHIEKIFFNTYMAKFKDELGDKLPALIPQVYLHYDQKTVEELGGKARLPRQRMDFLLLLPNNVRIVIELDGQQHYSDDSKPGSKANPSKYAEMVSEDRKLKLAGYDVYRFGGYEFQDKQKIEKDIEEFFRKLFKKHGIVE